MKQKYEISCRGVSKKMEIEGDDQIRIFFDEYLIPTLSGMNELEELEVRIPNIKHPMIIRCGTSDHAMFKQIMVDREYDIPTPEQPKFIIDGGANVGYGTIYFANTFPGAHIIAIEPEKSNFDILERNVDQYENIEVIQAAVWHESIMLNVIDIGLSTASFMVDPHFEDKLHSIKSICLSDVLQNSGFDEIDILKLDIEGAEREVFSHEYDEWLSRVNMLIIELHEFRKVGCHYSVSSAVSKYNFRTSKHGENYVLIRQK